MAELKTAAIVFLQGAETETVMAEDRDAREAIERGSENTGAGRHPAAGPHAKDHLTDHDKTPGTGSLPAKDSKDTDSGPE